MPRTQQQIETLEAQVAALGERLGLLEAQVEAADADAADAGVPARSLRRATARRASKRRAQTRALKPDTKSSVLEFLAAHPGSTAGEVAKGIDVNRSTVSSSLAQLSTLGRIQKVERGYDIVERD
jgi:predicted transcriptional regulator